MIKFRNNDKSIGLNKIHVMILFMNKRLIKSTQASVSVRKECFNLKMLTMIIMDYILLNIDIE